MSWVAVGVTTAAVVGGAVQANAANKASDAQQASEGRALDMQRQQLNLSREDQKPWVDAGKSALTALRNRLGLPTSGADMQIDVNDPRYKEILQSVYDRTNQEHIQRYGVNMGVGSGDGEYASQMASIQETARNEFAKKYGTPQGGQGGAQGDGTFGSLLRNFSQSDLDSDPVYKSGLEFGRKEGSDAINARAIAGGGYDSGATLKALTRFGNDYGSTKANDSFNRYTQNQNNIYNKLAGVSGSGQVSSQQIAATGANSTNQMTEALTGAGNARAAGIVGGANAWSGAATGAGNAGVYYQNNQILQKLLAQRGGTVPYDYNANAPS